MNIHKNTKIPTAEYIRVEPLPVFKSIKNNTIVILLVYICSKKWILSYNKPIPK